MTQVVQLDDLQVQVFFMQKEQEEQVLEEKPLGPPPGPWVSTLQKSPTLLKVCCGEYDEAGSPIRLLFDSV